MIKTRTADVEKRMAEFHAKVGTALTEALNAKTKTGNRKQSKIAPNKTDNM